MEEKELVLFSKGLYYTGLNVVNDPHHGMLINFVQAFPSPLLGHETQSVAIKEQDIDKVIEFLQSVKTK